MLTLWAACVITHPVVARSEAVAAGGFDSMSILCGDVLAHEAGGGSVPQLRHELASRGVAVTALDPYLAWYPTWSGTGGAGIHSDSQNIDEPTVLRYAEELEVASLTVLTPFSGSPAPQGAVVDALGRFADKAARIGVRLHLEPIPTSMIPGVATGWPLVREVGRANLGLVLDTFHLCRGGCTVEDLEAVPADRIFQVQLSDGPITPRHPDYFREAVTTRKFAGDGELPVRELVRGLAAKGALDNVGPEIFSPELDAMNLTAVGRLCRAKTDTFLASVSRCDMAANAPRRAGQPTTGGQI